MRTIIDLPDDQIAALQALGERENKSRAALIREAVGHLLEMKTFHKKHDHAAFGAWKGEGMVDGLEYQRMLRKEWDEREEKIWAPYRNKAE